MQQAVATLAALGLASVALPQHPFDLDPSFRTTLTEVGVNSVAPLPNGDVLLSGIMRYQGDLSDRAVIRVDHTGQLVQPFPDFVPGGGRLTPWNDQFYVGNEGLVNRIWPDGTWDMSFQQWTDPLFSSLQGGDYHVFPDGRVLMSGLHNLMDTARGFIGYYNLIWFTNTGRVDTTRIHRRTDGVVYAFKQLPDGKFICSAGTATEFEGTPIHVLFRIFPDGALDTSFHPALTWGEATDYLPLEDGRVVVAGQFKFEGSPDTLTLVRLLPDGTLDGTFNNHHDIRKTFRNNQLGYPWAITRLGDDRYAFCGVYDRMDGQVRGGIALLDSSGALLDEAFTGLGAIPYEYMSSTVQNVSGITPAGDGGYYVFGSYKGYDDGTTNDPTQHMVSRLYGLNVGIEEHSRRAAEFNLYPNPVSTSATLSFDLKGTNKGAFVRVLDATGKEALQLSIQGNTGQPVLDTRALSPGAYLIELFNGADRLAVEKLIVRP